VQRDPQRRDDLISRVRKNRADAYWGERARIRNRARRKKREHESLECREYSPVKRSARGSAQSTRLPVAGRSDPWGILEVVFRFGKKKSPDASGAL